MRENNPIPKISLEVAEKALSPLELQIYKLLLKFEEKEVRLIK